MVANKVLTLAFIRESQRILLGMKKRGFGEGRWNGFGGKVQSGESIEQAAIRETKEECGLDVGPLENIGLMMFEFVGDPQLLEVHVYQTNTYTGNIIESDEMRPQWFDYADVPFSQMWPDDKLWFPYMLRGEKFYGYFTFQGMDNIVDYKIKSLTSLEQVEIPTQPLSSAV